MAGRQNTTGRGGLQKAAGPAILAQCACEAPKFWNVLSDPRAMISDSFSPLYPPMPAGGCRCSELVGSGGAHAQTPSPARRRPPPVPTAAPATAKEDLVGVLKAAGNFKTFLKAVEAADLTSTLQKPGPLTVFAPTDTAFSKMPTGTLDDSAEA